MALSVSDVLHGAFDGQFANTTILTEDETFLLDNIYLHGYAVPEILHLASRQKVVVHEYVGGGRSIQALGMQPEPIQWKGQFVPQVGYFNQQTGQEFEAEVDPLGKALSLQALVSSGKIVDFVSGSLHFKVLVESFNYEIISKNRIEYTIRLLVLEQIDVKYVPRRDDVFLDQVGLLLSVVDNLNLLLTVLKESEIYLILTAEMVSALRASEYQIAALAALAIGNALAQGSGVGLINTANELTRLAVLIKTLGSSFGIL